MSVKRRLLVSFMIVLGIGVIAALMGIILLDTTGRNYANCMRYYGEAQGTVGRIGLNIHSTMAYASEMVNAQNEETWNLANEECFKKNEEISQMMDQLKPAMEKQKSSMIGATYNVKSKKVKETYAIYEGQVNDYETALKSIVNDSKAQENRSNAKERLEKELMPIVNQTAVMTKDMMNLLLETGQFEQSILLQGVVAFRIILIIIILIGVLTALLKVRKLSKHISDPACHMAEVAIQLANGNLSVDIDYTSKDEIGILAESLRTAVTSWKVYISEINRALREMSEGNFHITTNVDFKGDFVEIRDSINTILVSMSKTLKQINCSSNQVMNEASQVSEVSQAVSHGASEQADSIERLSGSIEKILGQVIAGAEKANQVSQKAFQTGNEINNSNHQMEQLVISMEEITKKSMEIIKIVKTIDDIANQTNILGMNAAIEAQRAGVAGRGFAVVADKVRNLARESAESARNTSTFIQETIAAIAHGSKIADETAASLADTALLVKESVQLIDEIAEASHGQAESVNQITVGIEQISSVVQTTSATAQESSAASEELYQQAALLRQLVSQFQLLE